MAGSPQPTIDEFTEWVAENASTIRRGSKKFGSQRVTPETELRYFEGVVSLVYVSYWYSSRLHFEDDPRFLRGLWMTLTTVVFGWWGIPWGPLWTPLVLFRNVTGGGRIRVAEILDLVLGRVEDNRTIVTLTPAGARFAIDEIARREFPAESALCITPGSADDAPFRVQFDLPEPSPHDFISRQHGLVVLVDKRAADDADGYTLDSDGERFLFLPPESR